jgi:hypothetical protein
MPYNTQQKQVVSGVIEKSDRPLTPGEIWQEAKKTIPEIVLYGSCPHSLSRGPGIPESFGLTLRNPRALTSFLKNDECQFLIARNASILPVRPLSRR